MQRGPLARLRRACPAALVTASILAVSASQAVAAQPPMPAGCKNPTVSGVVYTDTNGNGLFDSGEPPIAGNELELRNESSAVIGTTTTDANGAYAFFVDETAPNSSTVTPLELPSFAASATAFRTGTVAQFNPAAGCLVAVNVGRQVTINFQLKLENTTDAQVPYSTTVRRSATVTGPGVTSPLGTFAPESIVTEMSPYDGTDDYGGLSGFDSGLRSATLDAPPALVTDPEALAAYIGTGTVTFRVTADGGSSATLPANFNSSVSTRASAKATVGYTFQPVLGPRTYTVVQVKQPSGLSDFMETSGNTTPLPGTERSDRIVVSLPAGLGTTRPANNFGERLPVDLTISKDDGTTSVTAGGTTTYKIVAQNNGPGAAVGSKVTDELPPQLSALETTWTCVASSGSTCPAKGTGGIDATVDLANGGKATFTVQAKIVANATGTITNTVSIAAAEGLTETNTENNSATDIDKLAVPPGTPAGSPAGTPATPGTPQAATAPSGPARLRIVKTAPPSALSGQTIPYVIRVTNIGGTTARSVVVRDPLPAGVVLVSRQQLERRANARARVSHGTVSWSLGNLAPGASKVVLLSVRITGPNRSVVRNTAFASAANTPTVSDPADTDLRAIPRVIAPRVTG